MSLFLIIVFSAVGGAYVLYGKKQQDALILIIGVLLSVYPYFVENAFLVLLIGVALSVVPIARSKGWI